MLKFGKTTSKKRVDINVLYNKEVHDQLSTLITTTFPYDPIVRMDSTNLPHHGVNRTTAPQILKAWGEFKRNVSRLLRSATQAKRDRKSVAVEQLELLGENRGELGGLHGGRCGWSWVGKTNVGVGRLDGGALDRAVHLWQQLGSVVPS